MIYGALASLLEVPDGELRDMCVAIAIELGAWCRATDPLTAEQIALAMPAFRRLTGGGEMPAVDLDRAGGRPASGHVHGGTGRWHRPDD